jgi:thiamine-monophosphate kinase
MGAVPRWATLALSLSSADDAWLEKFSAGFFALARRHGVDLVGGDTTRGPLNLCVTIMGEVPVQQALRRDGARVGDEVWVSGTLGDAALALAHLQGRVRLSADDFAACATALHQPQPRVVLGLALRGIASSAIDISDGLVADLGHILERSHVGAQLEFAAVPMSQAMRSQPAFAPQCMLAGGDDYELCFTAAPKHHAALLRIASELKLPLTRIGKVVAALGCVVHDAAGNPIQLKSGGYDHF